MKKLILTCLIYFAFSSISVFASELTEDYFDIASEYATYGKYSDATVYVDKILQLEPNNPDAKELKNALVRVMNPNAKSYLTSFDKNYQQAENYKNQGNKSKQISQLASATSDYWSMFTLANIYKNNSDFKNAITYYQKAITLKPAFAQSYLGLAQSYYGLDDFKNAVNYVDKYLSYNPKSDIAYALRAQADMEMNYLVEAQDDIKKALDIEENISYLLIDAKIAYYRGNYDDAREKLNLLSRNVQTSEVYKYIGLCDYAQNDLPSALLNIDKAIILSDDDKDLNLKYNEIKSELDKQQQ